MVSDGIVLGFFLGGLVLMGRDGIWVFLVGGFCCGLD